jgi:DNA-binding HxlR family transcriptional regulator
MHQRLRYAELRAAIPDISDRMLSERLRELEAAGIVVRTVLPDPPVRVEYDLTEKGRALKPAMNAIGEWAERWIPGNAAATQAGGADAGKTPARTGGATTRPAAAAAATTATRAVATPTTSRPATTARPSSTSGSANTLASNDRLRKRRPVTSPSR